MTEPSPVVAVRALAVGEWPLARQVRLAAMADAPWAFGSTWEREAGLMETQWRERLADGGWFAAFAGDRAIGLACCYWESAESPSLVAMWVEPASRGSAAAGGLVGAVLDHARAGGASSVRLWVVATNARALALYERSGFRRTGARKPLPSDLAVEEIELLVELT